MCISQDLYSNQMFVWNLDLSETHLIKHILLSNHITVVLLFQDLIFPLNNPSYMCSFLRINGEYSLVTKKRIYFEAF